MTCLLTKPSKAKDPHNLGRDIMIMVNAGDVACEFITPVVAKEHPWRLFLDTSEESPKDIFPDMDGPLLDKKQRIVLPSKTTMVFYADE